MWRAVSPRMVLVSKPRSSLLLFVFTAACAQPTPAPVAAPGELELPFREVPKLERAFIDRSPESRGDGVPVGKLSVGKASVVALAERLAKDPANAYDSLLVAQNGTLLMESYFNRGRIDLPHPQASTTKAYTCLALGRAIQLGHLSMTDLDKPVVSFLDGLDPTRFIEGTERVTLAQALTMRSGIRLSDENKKRIYQGEDAPQGQQLIQAVFEQSAPISEESQTFEYQEDPTLVMQVLDSVVPGSAAEFISKEVLEKLGIRNYRWSTAPSGLPESGWGTRMTSRDMLKWGTLVMNKGRWRGEQLIPKAFIDRALRRTVLTGDDDIYGGGKDVSKQGYGFYWWSADLKSGDATYFASSAQGGGGQFILLIEELDLIVVVTAYDNDNTTLQTVAEHIIPAFR